MRISKGCEKHYSYLSDSYLQTSNSLKPKICDPFCLMFVSPVFDFHETILILFWAQFGKQRLVNPAYDH